MPVEQFQPDVSILGSAPDEFSRLLPLIKGKAYAASWVHVQRLIHERKTKDGDIEIFDPPRREVHQELVIVREDGVLFSDAPLPEAKPLSELGMELNLHEIPSARHLWSGDGIKKYLEGGRPSPASVFDGIVDVCDCFMDFHGSFGSQSEMCQLVACYVLTTYLLDAFSVTGYLWPNGEAGSGKSHLLMIISRLAYLGEFITAGGSFASLRDLAGYGATLCFDDAEKIMDARNGDVDKQSLLLAGNRKGTTVPIKVLVGDKRWMTRHINAFCPRCFSAIRLPIDTLASRTIFIPLLGSDDSERANSDPLDDESWPFNRREFIDGLWALALANLRKMPEYDRRATQLSGLSGRAYQPWRAIMAIALWLDEAGKPGLFESMKSLMVSYGKENNFRVGDRHLILNALRAVVDKSLRTNPTAKEIRFATKEVKDAINQMAKDEDLLDEQSHDDYITGKALGWAFRRMRLERPEGRHASQREWIVRVAELSRLERAHGIPGVNVTNGRNVTNVTPITTAGDGFMAKADEKQ